jgi:hypothetical protein
VSWGCWRDGVGCAVKWKVAGMQTLLSAVRDAGARQPVILGGVGDGADNLTDWLSHEPVDPAGALVAGIHVFDGGQCDSQLCWDGQLGAVAQKVPVVTTEAGSNGCAGRLLDSYTSWADAHQISYLAWAWTTWSTCHSLISKYNGTPANDFGRAYRTHLEELFRHVAGVRPGTTTTARPPNPGVVAGRPVTSVPALAGQAGDNPWNLNSSDLVPFLFGALVVLLALTTAASVMLSMALLRLRRSGVAVPRPAAEGLTVEPPLDDEQGVEFYGPAPAPADLADPPAEEQPPPGPTGEDARVGGGRRGRPAPAR